MTFTKTSQKFGQWSDVRANTVYGLGFPSEAELNKVIANQQSYTTRIVDDGSSKKFRALCNQTIFGVTNGALNY